MNEAAPSLFGLDPRSYEAHGFHGSDRTFPETNCYTDVWIELLHARGLDPTALMSFVVAVDFEGDQWTFFKPPEKDLQRLFGVDAHEMQPYRSLVDQIVSLLARGRTAIVEVDAFYLPDVAGTSYRQLHEKTSIAVEAIDPEREVLRYFHGPGLFELRDDDYRGVFRIGRPFSDDVLPPYMDLVRFDVGAPLAGAELREAVLDSLAHHLELRPRTNPVLRFGDALERDLPMLLEGDESMYHGYAFATVRQLGSAFEVGGSSLGWTLEGDPAKADVVADFSSVVDGCKALLFRLARRRAFDPSERVNEMAEAWERAMTRLDEAMARAGR